MSCTSPALQEKKWWKKCKDKMAPFVFDFKELLKVLSGKKAVAQSVFLLHAAKVRSSCEEGPGQSALQSAYHNPKLDVTKMKQNTTSSCSGQKLRSNKLTNQIKPTPE